MFKTIYVPVDNSEYANQAIEMALALARSWNATIVGSHVYAAKMHDYRFKQMEYTLREEYQDENELARQRKIHDSLITMGLQLISDSYLDVLQSRCQEAGLAYERKTFDGKHYKVLVEDIAQSDYDLVIMGALGIGAVKDSLIGSVCERVTRRVQRRLSWGLMGVRSALADSRRRSNSVKHFTSPLKWSRCTIPSCTMWRS